MVALNVLALTSGSSSLKSAALALIRFAQVHFPGVAQVACFDTQFHADLPEAARVLPIARALLSDGMRRYGLHGLSLECIVRQLGDALPQRLLNAHLGNGASINAVLAGLSIDTRMGMTPSGGVTLGTRSGGLDPGVLRGLDMLVFTGGIGENDAQVRSEICAGLAWTGISLGEARHCAARSPARCLISVGSSHCQVLVLPSQEDEQIARHAWAALA